MIITPHRCVHFNAENFAENINKTCKLKGRCQLISDKKSCSKYAYQADTGFWDKEGNYIENLELIQENEK